MKARKKPVEIEFYPCDWDFNYEIQQWATKERPIEILSEKPFIINIHTLEGVHKATKLDMIIKGVNGEVYPCKKDIFEKTYEIIK